MRPPGVAAFDARESARTGVYAFERETAQLEPAMKKIFQKNRTAWKYFEAQPPYYRKLAAWFIVSAKRDDTRAKRLEQLIDCSAKGVRLGQFIPTPKNKKP